MNLTKLAAVVTAVGVAISAFGSTAHAEELTGTLKGIKDTGTITLDVRDSSIPFSYNISGARTIGYSRDVATEIAEDVKKQFGLKDLEVNEIPVTSQNRIALLQNGAIGLECGSTANNLERQKQASFMNTIFIIGTYIMMKKDSDVKDWADLEGKNIVTTTGTTSERLLRRMNDEKQTGMDIISTKDHGQSFPALESGCTVAFMMDDTLPYGEHARAKGPAEWVVVAKPQSREAYGRMVRKDDKSFKALADKMITDMVKDGMINAEYRKWFKRPVPSKGVNMGFPLPDDMEALVRNPNDKALD